MTDFNDDLISVDSPEKLARYFVYIESSKKAGDKIIAFKNISSKKIYSENKSVFDGIFKIFKKYNLNAKAYVKYFIQKLKKSRFDLESDFASINTINLYAMSLSKEDSQFKIFNYYKKSAEKIAAACIANGFSDVRDYLRELIRTDRLAEKYITGEISQYYLATLKNLDKMVSRLGPLGREELQSIVIIKDKLNDDVQNAFKYVKNIGVNPVRYVNAIIAAA